MPKILNLQGSSEDEKADYAFATVNFDHRETITIPEQSLDGRVSWLPKAEAWLDEHCVGLWQARADIHLGRIELDCKHLGDAERFKEAVREGEVY